MWLRSLFISTFDVGKDIGMKKFIEKILIMGLILSMIIAVWCFAQRNDILVMTNSISLDTRLHEMRSIDASHFDVVGLGSSMTLYHLDGETFVENMDQDLSFYNFSAWGMSISDDERLMGYIVDKYSPKAIVMFSNIMDFTEGTSVINMDEVRAYLDNNPFNDLKLIIDYGFPNNMETKRLYKDRRFNPSELNEDLRYDEWGGVRLNVHGDDVIKARYDSTYEDNPNEVQYEALSNIATVCEDKGIGFYFVQMPYRRHFINDDSQEKINKHFNRCREIVESYGGNYLEITDLDKYSDEYFADSVHMNQEGAIMLTEEFAKWFKQKYIKDV